MKKYCLLLLSVLLILLAGCANAPSPQEAASGQPEAPVSQEPPVTVTNIIDRTETEFLPTCDALEGFYSDESYDYYFGSLKSGYVIVHYSDGSQEPVKDALAAGRATMEDLDRFGIGYGAELRYEAVGIRADARDGIRWDTYGYVRNREQMMLSSLRTLPIMHFSDRDTFQSFCGDIGECYYLTSTYHGADSFLEQTERYDDAWFAQNDLLVLAVFEPSSSVRHRVGTLAVKEGCVSVELLQTEEAEADEEANWFFLLEVPKATLEGCTEYSAWYIGL